MRRKPARNRRRVDGVAVARGQAAAGIFEGVAAIVCRESFEDFVQRIGLVAHGARAGRESTPAPSTPEQADSFQLLGARSLGCDLRAVAGWAAVGRFDRREGGAGHGTTQGARVVTDLQGGCGRGSAKSGARKRWRGKQLAAGVIAVGLRSQIQFTIGSSLTAPDESNSGYSADRFRSSQGRRRRFLLEESKICMQNHMARSSSRT